MNRSWKTYLKGDPVPWLMESNTYTRYRTLLDLRDIQPNSPEVIEAKEALLQDKKVAELLKETAEWFPVSFTRHNDPKMSHYKLRMLADFGLTIKDRGMKSIASAAASRIKEGLFTCRQELPERGKGFIKPDPQSSEWYAQPCDSPLITSALYTAGHRTQQVKKSIDIISEKWETATGWFCHLFFVESMFKKLKTGCPMAALMALELFSLIPEMKKSIQVKNAFEPLRFHYAYGKSIYYFGRSRKFWTLKYPFVWYNALYLAEVLTRFELFHTEPLVKELIDWIERSQDSSGRFTPSSMFMIYKGWDFANKKEPSPWITLLCCRILKRYYSGGKT